MIIDLITDAIRSNIGQLKSAPKGWNKRCCMLCVSRGHGIDKRNRFGIRFESNSISCNCFNCAFSASFTEGKELSKSFKFFMKEIHIDEKFIEYIDFEIFKQKNQLVSIRAGSEEGVIDKEIKYKTLFNKWQPIELPKDSLNLKEWLECGLDDVNFLKVVDYALSRKLFDIDNFYWTPDTQNNFHQRLLIPYYYKNKIVGYTARLCFDTVDKSIPKYYQKCPQDFVYNLDLQQDWLHKYVIVTEGVLDAYVVNGVSILGEIGQEKIDIINRLQKQIIVCPDRDKKGQDLIDVAIENGWAVSFPKWDIGIKDAAKASEKYGRLLTVHSIISSAIDGKLNIQLKRDIDHAERKRKRDF